MIFLDPKVPNFTYFCLLSISYFINFLGLCSKKLRFWSCLGWPWIRELWQPTCKMTFLSPKVPISTYFCLLSISYFVKFFGSLSKNSRFLVSLVGPDLANYENPPVKWLFWAQRYPILHIFASWAFLIL